MPTCGVPDILSSADRKTWYACLDGAPAYATDTFEGAATALRRMAVCSEDVYKIGEAIVSAAIREGAITRCSHCGGKL